MRYRDQEHFKGENGYLVNGVWYPRVTRILQIKAKPALEDFLREVGDYGAAEEIKQRSAEEGTLVHETAERLIRGESFEIPKAILPSMEAFEEFRRSHGIEFFPEFVERMVWSSRHRYAGRIDALVSLDGKFGVLDIKTSAGFYSDYNLQTAAYVLALNEYEVRKNLAIRRNIDTRWILRLDQERRCGQCSATLREKGGRRKIRPRREYSLPLCPPEEHRWGNLEGIAEIKEFPYSHADTKAFIATKILWEWEHNYWLKRIGYV
jgi:hypothetical protein